MLPKVTDRQSRSRRALVRDPLIGAVNPSTGDAARGAEDLVTVPHAGNISSDTRAGRARPPGVACSSSAA